MKKKLPLLKKKEKENPQKPKHAGGRPTIYTQELAQKICEVVACSPHGLSKMYEENDFFPSVDTIYAWRMKYAEFSSEYARAKLKQADLMAEYCVDIADKCNKDSWGQDRLRIDTRKWIASKLLPRAYGDRFILEQKNEENEQLKEELRELRAKLDAQNKKDY